MGKISENRFVKSLRQKYSKIKNYSFLIVPHDSSSEMKSYKLSTRNVVLAFLMYSFIGSVVGFIFYSVTGLGDYILPPRNAGVLRAEERVLVDKINLLLLELEGMKTANERLKRAVSLGDSTLFKDEVKPEKKEEKKNPADGSILYIFRKLFLGERDSVPKNPYFSKPVNGFISRDFNPDIGHMGVDFVVKSGTPVYSAGNGFIVFADFTSDDGFTIIIAHPDNFISFYKHCSVILKKERDNVLQGELIALSGNSGQITTGPHLHFELWKNGLPVNPGGYLINY
ncbi:MAG: M23 family metallopeptidase [Ignavibacteriales bacterium]|nr:MAG: M23 family metallopeptidase [Ignavibacteriales bacterium]